MANNINRDNNSIPSPLYSLNSFVNSKSQEEEVVSQNEDPQESNLECSFPNNLWEDDKRPRSRLRKLFQIELPFKSFGNLESGRDIDGDIYDEEEGLPFLNESPKPLRKKIKFQQSKTSLINNESNLIDNYSFEASKSTETLCQDAFYGVPHFSEEDFLLQNIEANKKPNCSRANALSSNADCYPTDQELRVATDHEELFKLLNSAGSSGESHTTTYSLTDSPSTNQFPTHNTLPKFEDFSDFINQSNENLQMNEFASVDSVPYDYQDSIAVDEIFHFDHETAFDLKGKPLKDVEVPLQSLNQSNETSSSKPSEEGAPTTKIGQILPTEPVPTVTTSASIDSIVAPTAFYAFSKQPVYKTENGFSCVGKKENLIGFQTVPDAKLNEVSYKKGRSFFTLAQLEILNRRFAQSHYVHKNQVSELARMLGSSDMQVRIWFQNRRTKYKKLLRSASFQFSKDLLPQEDRKQKDTSGVSSKGSLKLKTSGLRNPLKTPNSNYNPNEKGSVFLKMKDSGRLFKITESELIRTKTTEGICASSSSNKKDIWAQQSKVLTGNQTESMNTSISAQEKNVTIPGFSGKLLSTQNKIDLSDHNNLSLTCSSLPSTSSNSGCSKSTNELCVDEMTPYSNISDKNVTKPNSCVIKVQQKSSVPIVPVTSSVTKVTLPKHHQFPFNNLTRPTVFPCVISSFNKKNVSDPKILRPFLYRPSTKVVKIALVKTPNPTSQAINCAPINSHVSHFKTKTLDAVPQFKKPSIKKIFYPNTMVNTSIRMPYEPRPIMRNSSSNLNIEQNEVSVNQSGTSGIEDKNSHHPLLTETTEFNDNFSDLLVLHNSKDNDGVVLENSSLSASSNLLSSQSTLDCLLESLTSTDNVLIDAPGAESNPSGNKVDVAGNTDESSLSQMKTSELSFGEHNKDLQIFQSSYSSNNALPELSYGITDKHCTMENDAENFLDSLMDSI